MHEKVREFSLPVKKILLQIVLKMLFYIIMIRGIGIDLIEKKRIQEALNRWGIRFTEKILTDREEVQCSRKGDRIGSISARFAAKEAVLKALGTGWRPEIGWKDVEILSSEEGSPYILLHRGALKLAANGRISLSLTHSRELAAAVVVIENEENQKR